MENRVEQGYLGRLAAAKYLSVSSRLLDYVKAQGAIPFYRLSRRKVVFQVADLDRYMEQWRIDVTGQRDGSSADRRSDYAAELNKTKGGVK